MRCDLGSVDNPHDPPCVRCRREAKECYFSATRRRKRSNEDEQAASDPGGGTNECYEIRGGRKRLRASTGPEEEYDGGHPGDAPRTPGGSTGRPQPLRRPAAANLSLHDHVDPKTSEQTVGLLQSAEVYGGHDALKLLLEAAAVPQRQAPQRKASKESDGQRSSFKGISPASGPSITSPILDKSASMAMSPGDWMPPIRRDLPNQEASIPKSASCVATTPVHTAAYTAALKAWSRFRFVRAGWFTAREAIDYMVYFNDHLSPLTPVCLPNLRDYETHETLLVQEPMLTVTLLLITSRHMKLEGPGSVSRPYSIHQKLWGYLSGMVDRVVWGQEQFRGNACVAGTEPGCDVNPLDRKGLRTLGTVESLILLTEWHPRAMHFPPDETDEELMASDERAPTPDASEIADAPKGIGGQRMDAWLEPCWKSDRMCWMLLGISLSLAFEIGVFDAGEWQRHARTNDGKPLRADNLQTYDRRRGGVRDLLLIYLSQTSGRLGLTSMLPSSYTKPEDSDLYHRPISQHGSSQETVLHFWLRMAALIREGNQKIFANKAYTRDLIKNGDYKSVLESLRPPLRQWREDFDKCTVIPKHMRAILEIEYEHCRVYTNSLSLQAVAERCANEHPFQNIDPCMELIKSAVTTNGVQSDVAIEPRTLAKWLGGDRHYVLEVGDAARNLLKVVVEGLLPGGYLRHAPVRTYFRIISVSIMLLKSFSLGASEADVLDSLALMDQTVYALRGCVVDDVHVASRFADLLDILTQNLKPRLVRIAADGRAGKSRRVSSMQTPDIVGSSSAGASAGYPQQGQASMAAASNQPWSYSNGMGSNMTTAGPNNPRYGISNDAYDLTGENVFSIMPPPSFNFNSPESNLKHGISSTSNGTAIEAYSTAGFGDGNNMGDWFALPLDSLINNSGGEVNSTMYGPEIDGTDMLEILFSTPSAPNTNGNNTFQ